MVVQRRKLFLWCLSGFCAGLLAFFLNLPEPLKSILATSYLFLVPGFPWALFFTSGARRGPYVIFFSVVFSLLISLTAVIIRYVLGTGHFMTVLFMTQGFLMVCGILLMPSEIAVTDWGNMRAMVGKRLIIFLFSFFFLSFVAARIVPPLEDDDLDLVSTAYGLLHTLTPRSLTDRLLVYDFSHPLLPRFNVALTTLFSGKLPAVKYFFDSGQEARKLLLDAGRMPSAPLVAADLDSSEEELAEEIRVLEERMYGQFHREPMIGVIRMSNVFFGALSAVMLYEILVLFTASALFSAVGILIFMSVPAACVGMAAECQTSITYFASAALIYCSWEEEREVRKAHAFPFVAGFFLSQISGKAVVPVIAWVTSEIISRLRAHHRFLFHRSAAGQCLLGFGAGTVVYCVYGLIIDRGTFILDNLQYHGINRVLHIKDAMGYGYPSVVQLWQEWSGNVGMLFFVTSMIGLFLLVRSHAKRRAPGVNVQVALWFLLGAGFFSAIDWRALYHLVLLVIPLVVGFIAVLEWFRRRGLIWVSVFLIGTVLVRNIYSFIKISEGFYNFVGFARW